METGTRAQGGGATVADPVSGHLLDGRYRIGRRIARGGMASVYEALDVRLDRTCAVKIMHRGLGDDAAFAARFEREARAAARLSHPHVVNVYDQGEDPDLDGGTVYLVMELVPGHTLRDEIRDHAPMSPVRALGLMEPVVAALAAAHRAGLIHRDIKPENVLIGTDGEVKVADFGLAKAISADTQHTATGGVLIGTVSYLAPELVVDGTGDARADVYAAGVVLYELLTGHKPHAGESPIAVAYKHVHEDVPAPSLLAPGLPAYVDALVARATARDRDQRPADAAVLLHQLHRVAQALAGGVREDAELTADLAPAASARASAEPTVTVSEATDALAILPAVDPLQASPLPGAAGFVTASASEVSAAVPASGDTGGPGAPARAPRRSRRPRRGSVVLAVALAVALAAGIGAYWFGWARYTATPGVIGLSQQAAAAKLERAGFRVEVGTPAYSQDVARGLVVATSPAPGSRVLHHGTVVLTVSRGPELYAVPRLAHLTVNQAQDSLRNHHLAYGRSFLRYDDTAPRGTVLGSTPRSGRREPPDFQVDLVVSRGPRPIHVRDWTGRSAARAVAVMSGQGLNVDTSSREFSDRVPSGHVISQSPAGGVLHRGDTVTLTVSKGPQLVQIPGNLRAMGVQAATAELEALGFHVSVVHSDIYLGLGYVASSSPGPGQLARKGSTVVLKIV